MSRYVFFSIVFLLMFAGNGISSLKDVQIFGKGAVRQGEDFELKCVYDLEGAPLYSLKWYFNEAEFYRYVPKESPPQQVFKEPGIQVDLEHSDNQTVFMRNMKRDSTGYYKCEVSADAPLFHTDVKSIFVVIVAEPKMRPELLSEKSKYTEGQILRANCTSKRAFPAVNITWLINDQIVPHSKLKNASTTISSIVTAEFGGLESRTSWLNTIVNSSIIFRNGKLNLTCKASLYDLYSKTAVLVLQEDAPHSAHVLSPTESISATSDGYANFSWITMLPCLLLAGS